MTFSVPTSSCGPSSSPISRCDVVDSLSSVVVLALSSPEPWLCEVLAASSDIATEAATSGPPGLVVHYGDAGTVFLAGVSALADRDMVFA